MRVGKADTPFNSEQDLRCPLRELSAAQAALGTAGGAPQDDGP